MIQIQRSWCKDGFEYDPEKVIKWLATLNPAGSADRGICMLYAKLDLNMSVNGQAAGVRQLLGKPKHASNVILHAYAKK